MKILTAQMLREHNACSEAVEHFAALFPDGARITKAAIRKAQKDGLDIEWFIVYMLTAPAWAEYVRSRDAAQIDIILKYWTD